MENLKIELAKANEKNAKAESKQRESEEEISSLKRTCDILRMQVSEKDTIIVTMRNSVS